MSTNSDSGTRNDNDSGVGGSGVGGSGVGGSGVGGSGDDRDRTTRTREPDTREPDTRELDTGGSAREPAPKPHRQHGAEHDGARSTNPDSTEVLARQKDRFGGIKWGSAFFGWLTATGMTLLLTAIAAAAGTAFGLVATGGPEPAAAAAQDPSTAQTAGIVSAIVVLVVLLIAYYCGGYVAGRMARFNGLKQGLAVWLWAIVIAVVVAVVGLVAGSQFDILAVLGGFPRLPINEGVLTVGGLIAAAIAVIAALVGAILGGLAGMRYHRTIDRSGFEQ